MRMFPLVLIVLIQCVTADVSLHPNPNLIDLSWPYNDKTVSWIDFRNFTMETVFDGERTAEDGSKFWYVILIGVQFLLQFVRQTNDLRPIPSM